jgi:hypothetical protein
LAFCGIDFKSLISNDEWIAPISLSFQLLFFILMIPETLPAIKNLWIINLLYNFLIRKNAISIILIIKKHFRFKEHLITNSKSNL